jgi:hypothetical protein
MLAQERINPLGLVRREVVGNDMVFLAAELIDHDVGKEGHKLDQGVTRAVLSSTSPVLVLKATYSESVPCLKYSNQWRSVRPGDSGSTDSFAAKHLNRSFLIDAEHRRGLRPRSPGHRRRGSPPADATWCGAWPRCAPGHMRDVASKLCD